MDKKSLILKHFDKSALLIIKNQKYRKILSTLFLWLTDADMVKKDITIRQIIKSDHKIGAQIICREENTVLSGMEELEFLLAKFTKLKLIPLKKDKNIISKNQIIAKINGKASEVLGYERTILNILQRMSGIATQTNYLVNLISSNLKPIHIAATRKTPWMWLDKKAVAVGGGLTHRLNLSDGILIKDNHLALISKATKTPRGWQAERSEAMTPPTVKGSERLVEIEVNTEHQAIDALMTFRPNAIMLDNFTPESAKKTVENLKKQFDLSSIIIEASGGIDENNIKDWVKTGVDIISLGALTHSVKAANFSLEISISKPSISKPGLF